MKYSIHWFRRDLRVQGNQALRDSFKRSEGKVLGVFCFDKKFLSRDDFSHNRFQFFLQALIKLQDDLRDMGSDLLFMDIGPQDAFKKLLKDLKSPPQSISFSRDYEPFARSRDTQMEKYFQSEGIETVTSRDHLIIEPWELTKPGKDETYQVFTPFSKRWMDIFWTDEFQHRINPEMTGVGKKKPGKIFKLNWKQVLEKEYPDHLANYFKENSLHVDVEIPEAGHDAAVKIAKSFSSKLKNYKRDRDLPYLDGTSKLSLYLKNGSITPAQIISLLEPHKSKDEGPQTFLKELIWREFYYHILYHHKNVENDAFKPQYDKIKWQNNKKLFEAWKSGTTGFPIVDAGMRQLNTTGWMHNRVRMIVASFLVKDLLIDWRWGEKYFMDKLLDGDLAANNGGWQWAASTGCDAQPYFRIFNPWSQSKKFDPDAKYIKTYIPELSDYPAKKIHEPIVDHDIYPSPIVEHSKQRELALEMYKKVK